MRGLHATPLQILCESTADLASPTSNLAWRALKANTIFGAFSTIPTRGPGIDARLPHPQPADPLSWWGLYPPKWPNEGQSGGPQGTGAPNSSCSISPQIACAATMWICLIWGVESEDARTS